MRIDAHQHYWTLERNDYGWITPELPILYRNFLPQHLLPELMKQQIDKTIVVQAAATTAETEYILQLSAQDDTIAGVVGWLDLDDPAWRRQFEQFLQHPKFIGFRLMIQEMADPAEVLQPNIIAALNEAAGLDFPVDLLALSSQLPYVVKLLDSVPNLRAVVNHLCKPPIASGAIEPWKSQMSEIAGHPSVYCKLSGMVTEADHAHWQPADFTPYIRHIIAVFGEDRIIFGSDWPVCLLAASYDQVVEALLQSLPESWSQTKQAKLFGGNAANFYKLSFTVE